MTLTISFNPTDTNEMIKDSLVACGMDSLAATAAACDIAQHYDQVNPIRAAYWLGQAMVDINNDRNFRCNESLMYQALVNYIYAELNRLSA